MGLALSSLPPDALMDMDDSSNLADSNGASAKAEAKQEPFHVVGVGASAGGLEALETFFANTPMDSGLAYVVVQHLSPDFKSLMDELLARKTNLKIHVATEGMAVEPNAIYLNPPKKEMMISEGRLRLVKREEEKLSLPINVFFESLARDLRERAIGVILSGSGSDGSVGARAIHEAGGLVVVQRPETAKFDSMPEAAMDAGAANFSLPPDEIPGLLVKHAKQPFSSQLQPDADTPGLAGEPELAEVFALLLERYAIDFSHYKPTTIGRRIMRRAELSGTTDQLAYLARLREDRDELDQLYRDLLIGVTQFFRDPEAFDALAEKALPALLAEKSPNEDLRVWVAGCATGEEAYSLAILLQEKLEACPNPLTLRMFATDVHQQSLDIAARGIYSADRVAALNEERLRKHFVRDGDMYRVGKELRHTVVFAPHNVLRDAPFTKMDIVVCRNLLIYFEPPAQSRALALFHYALTVGGALFLGPSESVNEYVDEFAPINTRWKIFRKHRDSPLATVDNRLSFSSRGSRMVTGASSLVRSHTPLASPRLLRAYDTLLGDAISSSILLDEHFDVAHLFGDARNYLNPPVGRQTQNILGMVSEELRTVVGSAIQRVERERKKVSYRGVRSQCGEKPELLTVSVQPVPDPRAESMYYLLRLKSENAPPPAETETLEARFDTSEASRVHVHELETELRYTKEHLQLTIEELQTSNEELQATNEELVASNEELQSTNEELHSVNEELHTVNSEYQRKIDELTRLSTDMDNLLASTEVGVIYLDRDMCIRQFTRSAADFFNFLPKDEGRPITHFTGHINFAELIPAVESVLRDELPFESEVTNSRSQPFLMRILPYRTHKREVEGVVLAFIEIGKLKQVESELRETAGRLRQTNEELTDFNRLAVDRELTMVELKREINQLCAEAGAATRYEVDEEAAA